MKARFAKQQQPVSIVRSDGKIYIFLCLNEEQKSESYEDPDGGQIQETYYEYDYNEICGPEPEIPVADIQSHPEKYLDYKYTPASGDSGAKALEEIEKLKAAIERGLTV